MRLLGKLYAMRREDFSVCGLAQAVPLLQDTFALSFLTAVKKAGR
jgi:hypothetical protein